MQKDFRFKSLKALIETGSLHSFSEIFQVVPRSVVSGSLGINYKRMSRLIADPQSFTLAELITLANFIEVDPKIIFDLAFRQHSDRKKKATK